MPWAPLRRCEEPGCTERQPGRRCARHDGRSSRNHRGVPRQARGHGADYDRAAAMMRGQPCGLRLPGCTGVASGGDYTVPGDWTSPLQPACRHCQDAQGAAIARSHR